jgi:hypothetical protein
VHPYTHRGRAEEGGWSRREPGRGIGEKKAGAARQEEGGRSPLHVDLCPGGGPKVE